MTAPGVVNALDHAAACELAEKRAIAVYGAIYARRIASGDSHAIAHETADGAARCVPRPAPFRAPTALERQQAAQEWEARR